MLLAVSWPYRGHWLEAQSMDLAQVAWQGTLQDRGLNGSVCWIWPSLWRDSTEPLTEGKAGRGIRKAFSPLNSLALTSPKGYMSCKSVWPQASRAQLPERR